MYRFAQDRGADVQFRHMLIVEGVVWLILDNLGWARVGLTIRNATHKGGGEEKTNKPRDGNPSARK